MNANVLPLPAGDIEDLDAPTLLWCMRGPVEVSVDGVPHRIIQGEALWLPRGSRIRPRLRPGDVLVPVPGITCAEATRPVGVVIPASWQPWLLHAFGEALTYIDGSSSRLRLSGLLADSIPEIAPWEPPPAPASPELRALAAAIDSAPAVPVEELARIHLPGWSRRTLQRQFAQETGLGPEQWARHRRLDLAAGLLVDGRSVAAVAHRVGYATASGFSRRFTQTTGVPPGRWRAMRRGSARDVLRPAGIDAGTLLPAHRTWPRANGAHVAVWVAQGTAEIRIGSRVLALRRGDAMVIPAGSPNSIRLPQGSLLLPVGYLSGRAAPVAVPVSPVSIRSEEEGDLIREMVAAYTSVRWAGTDALAGFARVRGRAADGDAHGDDALVQALASAVSAGDVEEESLAGCARWAGRSERDISRVINERAGLTFAQWLRMSRMARARVRLQGGEAASAVSRGLGYAHLPAFTRAFREVHGATPREVAAAS